MTRKILRIVRAASMALCLAALTAAAGDDEWSDEEGWENEEAWKAKDEDQGGEHGEQPDHPRDRYRDRHRDGRDELLPVPGGSADERARDALGLDYPQPPVPWVDTGPATNVDAQIDSIGDLLNPKRPPPTRTRPPTQTTTPPPSTVGTTPSGTTPELVPDDTGLHSVEEIADSECLSSDPMAAARERIDLWGPGFCSDLADLKMKQRLQQEARERGEDPEKAVHWRSGDEMTKAMIENAAGEAVTAAATSCGTKITCEKVSCTTQCDATFEKMLESTGCKAKRRLIDGEWVIMDRLRVEVMGSCGCKCAAESACGGFVPAL